MTEFTDLQFHVLDLAVEGAFQFSDVAVPRQEPNEEVAATVLELYRRGYLEVSSCKETGPRRRRRTVRRRVLVPDEAKAAVVERANWQYPAEEPTKELPDMLPPYPYFQVDATSAGEDADARAYAERFGESEAGVE
jgi:hypothetical protein